MIDDGFEAHIELLLSVVLAKRRMQRVPVRVTCHSHIPGAQKKRRSENPMINPPQNCISRNKELGHTWITRRTT
jgi:predicted phosphodiesterase